MHTAQPTQLRSFTQTEWTDVDIVVEALSESFYGGCIEIARSSGGIPFSGAAECSESANPDSTVDCEIRDVTLNPAPLRYPVLAQRL
jgi:hypothetical protein